ncbi:histidinol-phosphatase HisJ [Eubacterium sp. 1001713B170207_170306_E7]|uniref:histidinol-phosphatase HisJ n=1 Tax=Eubacterium sp. 1001713B170207_170306_E7 TaxID=2787097 RepID=UPI00189B2460|nr:histidinol-phosphatase HisJ [Eubacterium sp. 1001713B170207_170306_E7]
MVHSNYHIHSNYCDGKNSLEEMVQAAIQAGLTSIGFTGHAPLPYENDWTMKKETVRSYMDEVRALAEKYREQIDISLGMEIDYFMWDEDISSDSRALIPELDFFIGSIHTIGRLKDGSVADIDYTPEIFEAGIRDCFGGSVETFVQRYYEALGNMAVKLKPDIVGHMDIIKKNNTDNRFFDDQESWYQEAVKDCLDKITASGSIIEINTGGMIRYGDRCLYPEAWLMAEIQERKIPITLNGDSHTTEGIHYAYEEVLELIKKIGFRAIMVRKKGSWTEERI